MSFNSGVFDGRQLAARKSNTFKSFKRIFRYNKNELLENPIKVYLESSLVK